MPGFEPGTSCAQGRRASRAALHPDKLLTQFDQFPTQPFTLFSLNDRGLSEEPNLLKKYNQNMLKYQTKYKDEQNDVTGCSIAGLNPTRQ